MISWKVPEVPDGRDWMLLDKRLRRCSKGLRFLGRFRMDGFGDGGGEGFKPE